MVKRRALVVCITLCLLSNAAFAASAWPEREHTAADYITLRGAGAMLYAEPGGYNEILGSDTLFTYKAELAFSQAVPLLSRFSWQSSTDVVLSPELVTDNDSESSYSQLFAELRLPFKTNFLSHQTSWYLQYGYTAKSLASVDMDFRYDGAVSNNDNASIGSSGHFIALAIDTPATAGDSPDSLSRFGVFYQFEKRLRGAESAILAEDELIGTDEHRMGFFYDITKPVFTEGFIMNIHLKLAYAFRNIHDNPYSYSRSDFNDSSSLMMLDVGTVLAYRFKLGDAGLRLFIDYDYYAIMALVAENDFNNGYGQQASAGLMLDYFF
ncbi:MAG: hypothetical protein LBV04_10515 [Deferribacteraceae bacterium]|jgi:hypothetical protein|nr:hypothetical protein [Deferribacteraceae bacterium]